MRVPALFVSPYAPAGRIDSTTYDFTSILRFIEDNWRIKPMTARDAAANSVGTTLDFSSAPRAPILPGPVYPDDAQPNPRARVALLGIYGIVILAIPAGAWLWWRRRPWSAPAPEGPMVGAGVTPGASIGTSVFPTPAVAGHVLLLKFVRQGHPLGEADGHRAVLVVADQERLVGQGVQRHLVVEDAGAAGRGADRDRRFVGADERFVGGEPAVRGADHAGRATLGFEQRLVDD
jgi:hypothetical protein